MYLTQVYSMKVTGYTVVLLVWYDFNTAKIFSVEKRPRKREHTISEVDSDGDAKLDLTNR